MLTKKQIHDLPKGEYKNSDLAHLFKTHGLKSRETNLPIDRNGNVISNIVGFAGEFTNIKMRLSRQMYKKYVTNGYRHALNRFHHR